MKKMMIALALMMAPSAVLAQDLTSQVSTSERSILPAGQFTWDDFDPSMGGIFVHVNLATQMAYVWRGEMLIGVSSISSGKDGKDTPVGTFPILQKDENHRSNRYNNAPMPYMMRMTWDGVALHAGQIPGYRASHGCVRLPKEFARQLFQVISEGDVVEVTNEAPDLQLASIK